MNFKLSADERSVKGEKIRTRNIVPAVVYGAGLKATSLTLDYDKFAKLYKEAGEASLIDLTVGGKEIGKVLIHDIQYDPVSDRISHVDLRNIDMNKPITAMVVLRFIGEAPVIKAQGGMLMHNVSEVEVKCLPKDLVSHIDVDLSVLNNFDTVIKIKDLNVPAGVVVVNPHAEDLVIKATAALTEDEIKALETASAADLSKIEVAGKKKEEEEAAAAGEEKKGEEAKGGDKPAAPAKEEKK